MEPESVAEGRALYAIATKRDPSPAARSATTTSAGAAVAAALTKGSLPVGADENVGAADPALPACTDPLVVASLPSDVEEANAWQFAVLTTLFCEPICEPKLTTTTCESRTDTFKDPSDPTVACWGASLDAVDSAPVPLASYDMPFHVVFCVASLPDAVSFERYTVLPDQAGRV